MLSTTFGMEESPLILDESILLIFDLELSSGVLGFLSAIAEQSFHGAIQALSPP